jgi:hypothetical protein
MNTSRTKKQTKPVKLSRLRREWFLKQESILNEITHLMTVTPYNKALDLINRMSRLNDAMLEGMVYIVFSENRPFSFRDFLHFQVEEKVWNDSWNVSQQGV